MNKPRTAGEPSNFSFGLLFAGIFLLIAFKHRHGASGLIFALLAGAAILLLITFLLPGLLTRPKRLWLKFGEWLQKFISPLVLGGLFLFVVTPYAIILRWLKVDLLKIQLDPSADSYWIKITPARLADAESLKRQF